jgi:hypothetical protein
MSNIMNCVAEHYMSITYEFGPPSRAPGDLLQVLHDGLEVQAARALSGNNS